MNRSWPRTVLGKCAADAWPRLLHEPHHSWVLPKRQTGGRAKAREALLNFSRGSHAVVRKRHEAVSVDDKVFGLQRVKQHNLRED
jgi:hypothetical protein